MEKIVLGLLMLAMLVACSDSGSSANGNGDDYFILDTDNQMFGMVMDRCLISGESTSWEEMHDTVYFRYVLFHDTLAIFKCGTEECSEDESIAVMTGGQQGSVFGTWTTLPDCNADSEEVFCDEEEDSYDNDFLLKQYIGSDDGYFELVKNEDFCALDELENYGFMPSGFMFEDLGFDEADYSLVENDCNTGKIKVGDVTLSVSVQQTASGNIARTVETYETSDKTCSYDKSISESYLQIPENACNETDMASYIRTRTDDYYVYAYDSDSGDYSDTEFMQCLADMTGGTYEDGSDE